MKILHIKDIDDNEIYHAILELIDLIDQENILKMPNFTKIDNSNVMLNEDDLQLNQVVFTDSKSSQVKTFPVPES